MKRAAIILAIVVAAGILLSSCNKNTCPAYSQAETEQTDPTA